MGSDIGYDVSLHGPLADSLCLLASEDTSIVIAEEIRWRDIYDWSPGKYLRLTVPFTSLNHCLFCLVQVQGESAGERAADRQRADRPAVRGRSGQGERHDQRGRGGEGEEEGRGRRVGMQLLEKTASPAVSVHKSDRNFTFTEVELG